MYPYALNSPANFTDPSGTVVPIVAALAASAKALGLGTAIGLGGSVLGFGIAGGLDSLFGGGGDGDGSDPCPPGGEPNGFFAKNGESFGNALANVAATNAAMVSVVGGAAIVGAAGPTVGAVAVANASKVPAVAAVAEVGVVAAAGVDGPGGSTPAAQAFNTMLSALDHAANKLSNLP